MVKAWISQICTSGWLCGVRVTSLKFTTWTGTTIVLLEARWPCTGRSQGTPLGSKGQQLGKRKVRWTSNAWASAALSHWTFLTASFPLRASGACYTGPKSQYSHSAVPPASQQCLLCKLFPWMPHVQDPSAAEAEPQLLTPQPGSQTLSAFTIPRK